MVPAIGVFDSSPINREGKMRSALPSKRAASRAEAADLRGLLRSGIFIPEERISD
jgi:hypothetical protein